MASRAGLDGPPGYATALALALVLLAATPSAAQLPQPGPPGPYVIDVRGATGGFPKDESFFPPVPSGTIVPSRGFGIDLGGHVYPMRIGPARLGFGVNLVRVRHSTSPPTTDAAPTSPPTQRTIPDVAATLTLIAPQVSFNFGNAEGWSFLSGGLGFAEVTTASSGTLTPATRGSGRLSSINVGFGARWFRNRHVAFAFDVRFHMVKGAPQPIPRVGTPKITLVVAAVGMSLR